MKKNMKRNACIMLTLMMTMGANAVAFAGDTKVAMPNNASVAVDGKSVDIGAYNIDGYNYFKLRDVAAILNGTGSNFEVGYDSAAKCIALTSNHSYSATGKELGSKTVGNKNASVSTQKIMLNGKEVGMQAYLIDGYNYFQLRELGDKLGFEVAWDNAAKAINMITSKDEKTQETDVQKLQKMIDETDEFGEIVLTGTYTGKPGDKVIVNKSVVFRGQNSVISGIEMEVNTNKQIWLDGMTFEGNKTATTAVHVKNAGAESAIVGCVFNNYLGDTVVIDKVEKGTTFKIADNKFNDFGLAETKMDAAITLNATVKNNAKYQIIDNMFTLTKSDADMNEDTMDVAFMTNDTKNAEDVYSETYVTFAGNEIHKGENVYTTDMSTDIPETNFTMNMQ